MTPASARQAANLAPVPPERRGECPTLQKPMQTGDGLLARLRPLDNRMTLAEWRALANAAADFGNGIVEVTARGSLQVRGLRPETVAPFERAVLSSGISVSAGVGIETPPLAGMDPEELIDIRPMAAELRRRIAEHLPPLVLAPKLAITLDGGGRFHLGDVSADLKVTAFRGEGGVKFLLAIAAPPSGLPAISPSRGEIGRSTRPASQKSTDDKAAAAALGADERAASQSLPLRGRWPAGQRGVATRGVAIVKQHEVIGAILSVLEKLAAIGPAARGKDLDLPLIAGHEISLISSPLVGIHESGLLGLAFAYCQARSPALLALADAAGALGARDFRLAPDHGFFVTGLAADKARELQDTARALAFITDPDDPRRSIALCAGARGCASAFFDTHVLAEKLQALAPGLLDGSLEVHLSGCAKGCAHPLPATITFFGARAGYGLVVNGAASATPATYIAENDIDAALARLQALLQQSKEDGESARDCLTRLGAGVIAAALQTDRT